MRLIGSYPSVGDIKVRRFSFEDEHGPMRTKEFEIALSTFERLREKFPVLSMNLDPHPSNMDVAMYIPAQPGLSVKVLLILQNRNELHLVVSGSLYQWFWYPCSNPEQVERYVEAVSGLLSGEFRIVEHWRGGRVVKEQLQRPDGSGWKTIATDIDALAIIPWPRKTLKVVQIQPSSSR